MNTQHGTSTRSLHFFYLQSLAVASLLLRLRSSRGCVLIWPHWSLGKRLESHPHVCVERHMPRVSVWQAALIAVAGAVSSFSVYQLLRCAFCTLFNFILVVYSWGQILQSSPFCRRGNRGSVGLCTLPKALFDGQLCLTAAPVLCLCRASSETLQGQEQQLVSSVLGQGLRSRDPLPGRAALARPFHLWEAGHPPCVAGVISTTAASRHVPGTVGGSISHRLPLLLHFRSHHSPLRFHKPQRHTALASRLSCLQDFCPSLLWEMSFTPFISRNLLHRDPHSAPRTCALRLSSRSRGLCAPAIRKGLAWPGRTDLMPKAGQLLASLLRFPWEKGPPRRSRPFPAGCCAQSTWAAPDTALRTVQIPS